MHKPTELSTFYDVTLGPNRNAHNIALSKHNFKSITKPTTLFNPLGELNNFTKIHMLITGITYIFFKKLLSCPKSGTNKNFTEDLHKI